MIKERPIILTHPMAWATLNTVEGRMKRFQDNGDGTITDNTTGLTWTRDANLFGLKNWEAAQAACRDCRIGGHADWRLPTINELQSTLDYSRFELALPEGHPLSGVQSTDYWSASTYTANTNFAWYMSPYNGFVFYGVKTDTHHVWPVRGGLL